MTGHDQQCPVTRKVGRPSSPILKVRFLGAVVLFDALVRLGTVFVDNPSRTDWLEKFFLSPGAGGLAAVLAATIGALALNRQLDHSKRTEREKSWWQSFEWVAARAVPANKEDIPLPRATSIDVLTSLTTWVSSETQSKACQGLLDELLEPTNTARQEDEKRTPTAVDASEPEEDATLDRINAAVARYVETTAGTPAQSAIARAVLYEAAVLFALSEVPLKEGETFRREGHIRTPASRPTPAPDALFESASARLVVEVKAWTNPVALNRIRETAKLKDRYPGHKIMVISPLDIGAAVQTAIPEGIRFLPWKNEEDTSNLIEAVRSELDSSDD